jgi:hypothetical protein
MPKTCPACDGFRTTVRNVSLKWWQKLLGRPEQVIEPWPTCAGRGVVLGTAKEEEVASTHTAILAIIQGHYGLEISCEWSAIELEYASARFSPSACGKQPMFAGQHHFAPKTSAQTSAESEPRAPQARLSRFRAVFKTIPKVFSRT